MNEPIPNNNEFEAAEIALRKVGSNLWFSNLSAEWQDFLVSNTLEHFDNYELSMQEAAISMISVFQKMVEMNPAIVDQNPWETTS